MAPVAKGNRVKRTPVLRSQFSAATVTAGRRKTFDTGAARARAARPDELVNGLSGNGAAAALRLEILRHLDQFGPRLVREIPRGWPVTRPHIRSLVNRLRQDGLLAFAANGDSAPRRRVALTEFGRRVLEEIDWNETIRLLEEESAG